MSLSSIAIRGVVGPLFVGHGTQKLFGWFGGHGPEGTAGFFESLGLRPGHRHARAAGLSETIGGALLMLGGPFTPLAGALITGTMVTAIRKVHAQNGPWVTNSGYEYNLVLIAAMVAATDEDAGKGWALAQLAAGVAGSYLATSPALNDTEAPAPAEGDTDTAGDPATRDAEPRFTRDDETARAEAGAASATAQASTAGDTA